MTVRSELYHGRYYLEIFTLEGMHIFSGKTAEQATDLAMAFIESYVSNHNTGPANLETPEANLS
jgi:hypothetical protein